MIQAVIFDMDGTLLNTLDDLYKSVNYALSEMNFPIRTKEEVRRFVGNGVKLLMERAVPKGCSLEDTELCINIFKDYYSKNMYNRTAPYDGITEILENLKNKNYKIAVVSNKFDLAVKELSKKYFGDLIDISIGQADDVPQKPAPNGVLKAIKCMGVQSAVYVGDSDVDVETAKNSNLPCIGVTWGFRERGFLKGADYIVNSPKELFKTIVSL